MVATTDIVVAAVGITAAGAYIFREQLFSAKPKAAAAAISTADADESSRDFVAKLKSTVRERPPRARL
jgi:NADPH-ferrihemoprotein reductase